MGLEFRRWIDPCGCGAVGLIHRDICEIPKEPRGSVCANRCRRQLGSLVDERRRDRTVDELLVGKDRPKERLVRGDTSDPVLGQCALQTADHGLEVPPPTGDLLDHRIEVGGDLHALVHTPVEAHARPGSRSVRNDSAGIWTEVVGRVLRSHPALHREAADLDVLLGKSEIGQRVPGGDAKLRFDQIDVCHFLGDGVFHLDPRVHLDEDMPSAPVDEELDRSRVRVVDRTCEANCVIE